MKRLLTCLLATSALAPAQEVWTADEAGAVAFLSGLKKDHEAALGRHQRHGRVPVFVPSDFVRSMYLAHLRERLEKGKPYRIETSRVTVPDGQLCLLTYLLPAQPDSRVFVSDMQGRILIADHQDINYLTGDAAMPHNNREADGLTIETTIGRDGRTWQPLSTAPMTAQTIYIIDEHGKPFDDVLLTVGPASWFDKTDEALRVPVTEFALPAGVVASKKGRATLQGVVARDLYLGARHAFAIARRVSYLLEGVRVERSNDRIVVTVPRAPLRSMFCHVNENATHSTLKILSSGQCQCMASAVIDVDGDDRGEAGFLAELTGVVTARSPAPAGEHKRWPSVMPKSFGELKHGCVIRSGYLLQVSLPGKQGWVTEGDAEAKAVDPDLSERAWRCYAWPLEAGKTGARAFFIDHTGTVYVSDNKSGRYSGYNKRPAAAAAVSAAGIDATVAKNGTGVDGQVWLPFVYEPPVGARGFR